MNQAEVASRIIIELVEAGIITKENELPAYRYLEQAYAAGYDIGRNNNPLRKRVAQFTKDGNLVKIHDSVTMASREMSVTHKAISRAARESTNSKGFKWKYVDNITSEEQIQRIESVRRLSTQPK